MKIVVAGGAGFIGSSICLHLRKKYPQYQITAFDNLRRRGSELNLPDLKKHNITFIHGDIRNAEDLDNLQGFDVLIEASAEPSVMSGLTSDPSYVINNNFNGSINCFNVCLKNKAKLIFLSSSRVYPINRIESANTVEQTTRFEFTDQQKEKGISARGISEELNMSGARSFYGATKLASELFLEEYAAFYNLPYSIIRFGVIAGPRQMGKTDQGVATLWMANHYWKQSLKYFGYGGSGKQVRDILHVDDAVDLVDMQLHEPSKFEGKIFNAGGGRQNSASLLELTELCSKITGNKIKIDKELKDRPADLRIFISDNSKIESETNWKPQRSLEQTLKDIFHWIRQNEKSLETILK